MSYDSNNDPDNTALPGDTALPHDIAALLADEATWAPVSDELAAATVASVLAEARASDHRLTEEPQTAPADVRPVRQATTTKVVAPPNRWKAAALGAAAALILVAGIVGVATLGARTNPDLELALAGTELAPQATAQAEITETPAGTRIVIEVANLDPAPQGMYYQAWLRKDASVGVSAGTFHLRNGDDPIELWAGVSTDDYPLLTVTLQEEAQTESSGRVVLKALIGSS